MNKKELIVQIAEQTGLARNKVKEVIEAFCNITSESISNGDSVRLLGFGTFEIKKRSARVGKNPRTGEMVAIPASVVPVFKAGKHLKKIVRGQ